MMPLFFFGGGRGGGAGGRGGGDISIVSRLKVLKVIRHKYFNKKNYCLHLIYRFTRLLSGKLMIETLD